MKNKRGIVLSTGVVVLMFMGLIYAWSIFVGPLEAEFGWLRSQTSLTFSISMLAFAVGGIASGYIQKKSSNRVVITLGIILIAAGFMLSSMMTELWQLFVFYGVTCGLGVGLCYNAWLGYTLKIYRDKTGMASGVLLLGFGLGGFVLGKVVSNMLYAESVGWRKTFMILGIAIVIVGIFSVIIVNDKKNPEEVEREKSCIDKQAACTESSGTLSMIRSSVYWYYILWCCTLLGVGLAVIGQAAMLAIDMGATKSFAATCVGLLSIGNGGARVVIGVVFDRYGMKKASYLATFVTFLGNLILFLAYKTAVLPLGVVALLLCGAGYGFISAVNPACTKKLFGDESFQQNYGVVFLCSSPAIFIGNSMASAIKEITGSYQMFFAIAIIIVVAGFVFLKKIEKKL
ncbi:MAG: nitrate/nitrite transporter [Anaerovoracaceae bacterium]